MIKRDANCTKCKLHKTAEYVCLLGKGPEPCEIMVVGEAPGKREDDSGKPFVGKSGGLLRESLETAGLDPEDIFITNAVSCRPPENRTPTKGEIKACSHWLKHQFKWVKPKFVLLLGNVPLMSITGKAGITKRRGKPFEQDGVIYLPTFHPSFILRDPRQKFFFERDLKLFKEIIEGGGLPQEEKLDIVLVDTWDKFDDLLDALYGCVSFDIETTQLYPWRQKVWKKIKKHPQKGVWTDGPKPAVVSIGFGTKKHQWIIPVNHPESMWSKTAIDKMVERLTERMGDCLLVAHNGKFDFLWMWVHYGVKWFEHFHFDTQYAHYLLDENDLHGLKYVAQKLLGAPDWEIDKEQKQGHGPLKKLMVYHAHDLYYTRELRYHLGKELFKEGDVKRVFDKIMMPCARLFVEVEYDGVYVNHEMFDDVEVYLRKAKDDAEKKLKKWGDINWGSPQQVAKLLFEDLGLESIEKTKGGAESTSESVILRLDHPIADDLLAFRGAKQQLSFFIEGWKPYLHKRQNGYYLHPSFKLHGTVTGRLSCEHPNLQQVPRDERIRQLITAPPGWTLVEADLSQIELRIAAELANERHMLEAFLTGVDVHWLTCIREIERGGGQKDLMLSTAKKATGRAVRYAEAVQIVLELGPDKAQSFEHAWKELRKKAKAINFGYLYGMWWKKFKIYARDNYGVKVTDEEAQDSRKFFFDTFSDFPNWHNRQRKYARRHGYVRSMSGRKRRLPDAQRPQDDGFRQEAERQAINSPVQSFANELNLMSAIQLRKEFGRDVVRICGTIHDSILMWVKNEHVETVTSRLLEIMTHPELLDVFGIDIGVPIMAESKVGPWGIGIGFHKWLKEQNAGNENTKRKKAA